MKRVFAKKASIVFIVLSAILLGILVQQWVSNKNLPNTPSITLIPNGKPLVDVTFADYHGRDHTLNNWLGKWHLVFFGYTHCPDICPTALQTLKQVKQKVSAQHSWDNYQVVFISVDPQRDDVEQLKNYVPYFDADFIGLTGTDAETTAFAKQLGVVYVNHSKTKLSKASQNESDNKNYDVDHSAGIVLINPQAQLAGYISAPYNADQISQDLIALAKYYEKGDLKIPHAQPDIQISDAWIRPAPPNAKAMAAYFTISNNTNVPITIEESESPNFAMTMIHDSKIENGIAKMVHMDGLTIPANSTIILKPHGIHVMLMRPNASYHVGDKITLTLTTEQGIMLTQDIEIKPQPK